MKIKGKNLETLSLKELFKLEKDKTLSRKEKDEVMREIESRMDEGSFYGDEGW